MEPACYREADVNADLCISFADITSLLQHLFDPRGSAYQGKTCLDPILIWQNAAKIDYSAIPTGKSCTGDPANPGGLVYTPGDANDDGVVNISDVSSIADNLGKFIQGAPYNFPCLREADANGNCLIEFSDVHRVSNYLFRGGLPPELVPNSNCP